MLFTDIIIKIKQFLILKGSIFMNNFFKAIVSIFAVIGAIFGALVIIDKWSNKNRIKGDYLECDVEEATEETEEEF